MAFLVPVALGGAMTAGTASTIGLVASVAGAGIGALGAIQSARAQSASAKYNAQVQQNNAQIAKQNATWAAQAGEAQAGASQMKTRAVVGGIIANQAASGVDLTRGSSLDVRSSARELGELDAINIRSNAAREAYGYETNASSFTAQSQLDKFQSGAAMSSGYVNAGGTILGGVGSAGLGYARYMEGN